MAGDKEIERIKEIIGSHVQNHSRQTASIFVIPGEVVLAVVALFYAIVVGIVIWSAQRERTQEFEG